MCRGPTDTSDDRGLVILRQLPLLHRAVEGLLQSGTDLRALLVATGNVDNVST